MRRLQGPVAARLSHGGSCSMAWVNNNKKNARFNPNRRDDRLMESEVISRRVHRKKRETEPEIELVSTDPSHVLSMGGETRVDWLQMALMQAGLGKLKVDALHKVLTNPAFGPSEKKVRKELKANVMANLHLFNAKQKKNIEEAVGAWTSASGGGDDAEERERPSAGAGAGKDKERSSSASNSRGRRKKEKDKDRDKDKDREKEKNKDKEKHAGERRRRARSKSREKSRSASRDKSRSRSRDKSRSRQRSRSRGRRRR